MQDYRKDKLPARNIDEARLMANVNTRAGRLFRDDYRAKRLTADTIRITSPDGAEYVVDKANDECDCPFFTKHFGKYPCKHLLGADKLIAEQKARQAHNIREWAGMAMVGSFGRSREDHVSQGGAWK